MNFTVWSDKLSDFILSKGFTNGQHENMYLFVALVCLTALCWGIWAFTRIIIIQVVKRVITKTKTHWDDQLFEYTHSHFCHYMHGCAACFSLFSQCALLRAYCL
jgi:hypothetical protein